MKVELDNITLGYSDLSGSVFAGIPLKAGTWRHKVNVTNSFIACVIAKWNGFEENFNYGDKQYEITVKEVTSKKVSKKAVFGKSNGTHKSAKPKDRSTSEPPQEQ